jgi:hypothetical protein
MTKIKLIIYMLLIFQTGIVFSQQSRDVKVSFTKGNKELSNIRFYLVKGNDAFLLKQNNDILTIPIDGLDENQEIKLLVIKDKENLTFYVKPKKMYYLKITKMSFNLKYLLKRMYIVNEGFDYEEIVKKNKKKYNLME